MIYLVAILTLSVFVLFLFLGARYRQLWLLYLVNLFWMIGLVLVSFFTLEVWTNRAYSEKWEMIGVLIFALPVTIIVWVSALAELLFLRRSSGRAITILRVLACLIPGLMAALVVSAFLM
ncbi:MAG TPA: hypothetical protein PK014_04055 [Thermoanaerobaculia bacterium]|nr:hypothetical protein [Thermoanaerobaculia bacterium]HUM29230.1 hypothetical protein [Thermoanaerobaculia bacterium]HXK67811.1 hypothetical protein [Thermoanaerobaculia bacterium]